MKILQLTYSLGNGGAEKFIVELSNELAKNNDVILCSCKAIEDWMIPPRKINKNVKYISFNSKKKYSLTNWRLLYNLIKCEAPDIVHVHSSLVMLYIMLFPILFRKIRYYQTIHSYLTIAYRKLFFILNFFTFLKNSFSHICISERIYEEFREKYKNCRFYHIDNGLVGLEKTELYEDVSTEISGLKNHFNDSVLLAIGNYSDEKRFDLLMDIMNHYERKVGHIILIVLGEDRTEQQVNYKKVLAKKGSNSHLLGLKTNVGDYIAFSDALIMSSSMEGMPLVILEAFSLGKPVITTPAGGIINMVKEGVNGYIAMDLSEQSLIETIERFLLASRTDIEEIRKNNLEEFSKKYSISICAERYLQIFNPCI